MNARHGDAGLHNYLSSRYRRRDPREFRWFVFFSVGVFLIGLTLLFTHRAEAATVKLTCTAPTKNTDGTTITAALTYKAYWGTSATSLPNAVALAGPGCAGPVVVPDPAAGASVTYHFAVTAIAGATATSIGMESSKSIIATKTVSTPLPTPNPPTLLLTEGGLVWQASPNYTNFSWKLGAQVGTIVAGIKCDATRRIGEDFYRVTAPIVWTAGRKDYAVAKCERKA